MNIWAPNTVEDNGDLVKPATVPLISIPSPQNPSFETGDSTGWPGLPGELVIVGDSTAFDGSYICELTGQTGTTVYYGENATYLPVTPGKTTTVTGHGKHFGTNSGTYKGYMRLLLHWYSDNAGTLVSTDEQTDVHLNVDNGWISNTFSASAPAGAKYVRIGFGLRNADTVTTAVDDFSVDLGYDQPPFSLVYQATQTGPATTGATEPTWPTTVGLTVVDGGVTWTTVYPNRVTWTTEPLYVSGATEPVWPAAIGGTVKDNSILWTATSQRVKDSKCPNSKYVTIINSKVYAVNDDIINYSATVNPLDWTTLGDAGYIPFGLQRYGSSPAMALGLYRGNIVAFNAEGFQMWQTDPDPANIQLLDALPLGSVHHHSLAPFDNDLAFLSEYGVRTLATASASESLETGQTGEPVDPLVMEAVNAGGEMLAFYNAPLGQYLLGFVDYPTAGKTTVFVYTAASKSWSRYLLPYSADYYCNADGVLAFRNGDDIVKFDQSATDDSGTAIEGIVQWPWLDMGAPGVSKQLEGIDLISDGSPTFSIAYDPANVGSEYAVGTLPAVTTTEGVVAIDGVLFSASFKFTYAAAPWRLYIAKIYASPLGGRL